MDCFSYKGHKCVLRVSGGDVTERKFRYGAIGKGDHIVDCVFPTGEPDVFYVYREDMPRYKRMVQEFGRGEHELKVWIEGEGGILKSLMWKYTL